MSYKNREVQPEFFCGIKKKEKRSIFHKKIFEDHYKASFSISCDTLIVIVIALLMINLTSFVVGIERGKVLAKASPDTKSGKKNAKVMLKEVPQPESDIQVIQTETQAEEIKEIEKAKDSPPEPEIANKGYIIQLVTYSSNSCADREVASLRAQGYSSNVLQSGEYFVVYAGTYESKTMAKEELTRFKKRYKDCFVRFLKNT